MNNFLRNRSGEIYMLLSAALFALGGLFIKLSSWGSLSLNGMRSVFAFAMMFFYLRSIHHKFKFNAAVLLGAVANTGMSVSFVIANRLTTAANTIVLQFTMPVFLILLLWLIWHQKPTGKEIITVALSLAGVMCFFFESLVIGGMAGNLLAVFSGFLYALVFLIKKVPGADFESSILVSFGLSVVIGVPFLLQETDFGAMNWGCAVVLGCFQQGLAYIFMAKGMAKVQPLAGALLSMLEPILSPILVATFYGEKMGLLAVIGAVIVLGSALSYNISDIKKS